MLSKQFNLRSFSKLSNSSKLNPWFVTGLIDAEGSFTVLVIKDIRRKLGWRIECKFQIGLHERDLALLLKIQVFLEDIGKIYKTPKFVNYIISSNSDLLILINHLKNYPLLTQKGGDFLLFKQVVELMNNKSHLNIEGLNQIVNIKASINLGLSKQLKSEFNQFSPVVRPIIKTDIISDPN
jgi:LAGLIDADG endonuclease